MSNPREGGRYVLIDGAHIRVPEGWEPGDALPPAGSDTAAGGDNDAGEQPREGE